MDLATVEKGSFEPFLGGVFEVSRGSAQVGEFKLVEVTGYWDGRSEAAHPKFYEGKREPFSLLFAGPPGEVLPQGISHFEHEQLGEFEIFITAVSANDEHVFYEAVFN